MIQNKTIITILLIGITTLALAQVDTAWVRRWSTTPITASDYVYGLTVDNDGNVYITGCGDYLGSISDIITMKYGPNGDSIWASIYQKNASQMARSVAVGNSGCVYVTGYTMESGNGDFITIKYYPNGDTQWVKRYNGIGLTRYEFSRKLVIDAQENVYISGYSQETNYNYTQAIIKYDSAGNQIWAKRDSFGGGYPFTPNNLVLDNSGNPYIVTKTKHSTQGDNYVVAKYKAETGDTYWVRTYNGPADTTDNALGIAIDNSDNVYVTGTSYGGDSTGYDIATIKYNSSGDTQWVRRWSNPDTVGGDEGYWIAVDGSGNVYVYGRTFEKYPNNYDLVVLKYNSSGVFQWATKYSGPGGIDYVIDEDGQNGMALDAYGFVYVTGYSRQQLLETKNDFVTIKLNPDGDTMWTKRYDWADSMETARSMYLDNLGNIYVTGQSNGLGRAYDITTIKYYQSDFPIRDVRVSKLELPALVDSGYVVAPACSVYNNGDSIENYQVRMKIGSFYNNTLPVTNHSPGTYQYLTFPNWIATQRGYRVVSCSTELSVDMIHSNDKKIDSVMVRVLDVGVTKIEAPTGTIETGTIVTPACSVYNYGSTNESYSVRMKIGTFYDNTAPVTGHAPGTYQYVEFTDWTANELGTHAVSCSTEMTGDVNNNNDQLTESVTVVPAVTNWEPMADVPQAPSGKNPKSGSCMAGLEATGLIYFLKASNRSDFYSYDPTANIWNAIETIPKGEKGTDYSDGKYPKRGAAMAAYEPDKCVFVVRGNNRLGFWKYQADILGSGDTIGWKKMATIPVGAKRCKYGTGLTLVEKGGNDYLFLMKGAKTSEFYLYDIENDSWTTTSSPPVGASGKTGYKKGSILAYDGNENVYVLQGYYGSFFKYDVERDSWTQLRQYNYREMRNRDGRKKKFKDGAAMVYYNDVCYCLKGGNTVEVWKYTVTSDSWTQMPVSWDIPLGPTGRKKVKDGGSMIMFEDFFWASKGKNTPEFYRHSLPTDAKAMVSYQPTNEGTMGKKVNAGIFNLTIAPNPAINLTTIRYNLPRAKPVGFKLFDITGSIVKSYTNTNPTKQGVIMIDTKTLASGVYILRFDSGDYRLTRKLVLEK